MKGIRASTRARRRPTRVIALVDSLGLAGGGEKMARVLLAALDPDRFRRTLCISHWSPEIAATPGSQRVLDELRDQGVEFLGLERSSRASLGSWRPLLRRLREDTHVLHTHKFGSNVWGAVLAQLARVPVFVAHEHTWSYEGRPMRRFLDRELIARRSDAFVAVSEADRRRMIELEGIDSDDVVLVHNGIAPLPAASGHDVRAELGIPAKAPVIGTVASLRPQKAFEVLLDAAKLLRRRFPDLRVLIAGDGEERERLAREVRERSLEGTVMLLGRRLDVPDLLAAFDLSASTSDFEGTPLALMEAMAAGLPVVATSVGGVPDLIEPGVHGLLVPPRDPAAFARAAGELLSDRERAAQMGRRGRERQRREFDVAITADRIAALYERLLTASGEFR